MIDATIILHNMLIDFREEEREDMMHRDDISEIDDAMRAPYEEDDVLNRGVPSWAPKDRRRQQLLNYLKEFFMF
jgi:hypothetical protein